MYGKWNPELNGVSVARNPNPHEQGWKQVVPVRPPLGDGQMWADPTYSMDEEGVIYETWAVVDAPVDSGLPTISIQDLRTRMHTQTSVAGLKSVLDDILSIVDPTDPTRIV